MTQSAYRVLVSVARAVLMVLCFEAIHVQAAQPYLPVYPDPIREAWRWQVFPELKGLGLSCMTEGADGHLWFGLLNEVRRFDGYAWTSYTREDGLYGSPVTALCEATDGSIYAGTAWGISRFYGGNWSRVFPAAEGDGGPQADDVAWPITGLAVGRDGSVWASSWWGVICLRPRESRVYTTPELAISLRTLFPRAALEALPETPVTRSLNGLGIRTLSTTDGEPVVAHVVPGGGGATAGLRVGDRLLMVDGKPGRESPRLSGSHGTQMLLSFHREGVAAPVEAIAMFDSSRAVADHSILADDVVEDAEGRVWFALHLPNGVLSNEGGLLRFSPSAASDGSGDWHLFKGPEGSGIGGHPRVTQAGDGSIWSTSYWRDFATVRVVGDTLRSVALPEEVKTGHSDILGTRDGTLWISGVLGRLFALRDGVWTSYTGMELPFSRAKLARLYEARDGALWFLGEGDMPSRLDLGPSRFTTYRNLNFEVEAPDGSLWFVQKNSDAEEAGVVRFEPGGAEGNGTWTRYATEDGLMSRPERVIVGHDGELWAWGTETRRVSTIDRSQAAVSLPSGWEIAAVTARFDGERWHPTVHPSTGSAYRAYAAPDGSLWFGAVGTGGRFEEGLLRFDGGIWTRFTHADGVGGIYGIAQTSDGHVWSGKEGLNRYDGRSWSPVQDPEELSFPYLDAIYADRKGDLWVGHRSHGLFQYHPEDSTWTHYGVDNGLADNRVYSIVHLQDGSHLVATREGYSRFDGKTWTLSTLPEGLPVARQLRQSADGAIWINGSRTQDFHTVRYVPGTDPPDTEITLSVSEVSQPGNTTLAWRGGDAWIETREEDLQFSWRMDTGSWTPFSRKTNDVFLEVPVGVHTFEVKARDRDFNEDPTPALVRFEVLPPVWRQPWFVALMAVMCGGFSFQTARVLRRDRRLREANDALSDANRELFGLNRDLQSANSEIQTQTERKSAFLASMSHELRTPMNAIVGFTNLVLRREPTLTDQGKANLEKVSQASGHLLAQINDLLDLSKIEAGKMEVDVKVFDLREMIEYCVSTVSPLVKSGVELSADVDASVTTANTDEQRVRQMVINLLSNAVKFTDDGSVTVSAICASLDTPSSAAASSGTPDSANLLRQGHGGQAATTGRQDKRSSGAKVLVISVSDTGKGIPEEELSTLFDEYRQVSGQSESDVQKGTGLGLSITKKFAELLGGTIEVESEVGKGSVFTVRIPVNYEERN